MTGPPELVRMKTDLSHAWTLAWWTDPVRSWNLWIRAPQTTLRNAVYLLSPPSKQAAVSRWMWMRLLQEESHGSLQREVPAKSCANPLSKARETTRLLDQSRGPMMCK